MINEWVITLCTLPPLIFAYSIRTRCRYLRDEVVYFFNLQISRKTFYQPKFKVSTIAMKMSI